MVHTCIRNPYNAGIFFDEPWRTMGFFNLKKIRPSQLSMDTTITDKLVNDSIVDKFDQFTATTEK